MASPPEGSLSFGRDFYFPNFKQGIANFKNRRYLCPCRSHRRSPDRGVQRGGGKDIKSVYLTFCS